MLTGFTYRGLSPHKFTSMPGVHKRMHLTKNSCAILASDPERWVPPSHHVFNINFRRFLIVVAKCDIIFIMKAKHRKILRAVFAMPTRANIKFTDIESLLVSLGGEVKEGAGSRMSVTVFGKTVFFHRPHPVPARRQKNTKWKMPGNFYKQ